MNSNQKFRVTILGIGSLTGYILLTFAWYFPAIIPVFGVLKYITLPIIFCGLMYYSFLFGKGWDNLWA